MTPASEPRPRQRHYSVRHHARLDAETHAKLDALANTFHQKRGAVLRYVMQWGLAHTQGWTINPLIPERFHLMHMLVEPNLLQQVEAAAEAHHVTVASWLRQAMLQVIPDEFPPSWRVGETSVHSHESGYFHRKFGLRLDEVTSRKLEAFTQTFDRAAAEIIRQLIIQTTLEDFPPSWLLAARERRPPRAPLRDG
jgi:predicted transcriptional regulator